MTDNKGRVEAVAMVAKQVGKYACESLQWFTVGCLAGWMLHTAYYREQLYEYAEIAMKRQAVAEILTEYGCMNILEVKP